MQNHPRPDSEDALERETMDVFREMGWTLIDAMYEGFGPTGTLGRDDDTQVILEPRLRTALEKLNPTLPPRFREMILDRAVAILLENRGLLTPARANKEVYILLKHGIPVPYDDESGERAIAHVRVIDWDCYTDNDFLMVSQFWIKGELHRRRADLVGFVNGIPLLFIELKAHHKSAELAYMKNLSDYKNTIPRIFWYNALVILSNGSDSKIGSMTAEWDHFTDWKRINDEGEEGIISLDTMIRGTCEPTRFLDIVENFVVFTEMSQGLVKLVPRNHQYLGVNKAFRDIDNYRSKEGKLGVFWHSQGSGKTYSMIAYSQKILRKVEGNFTFLVVTDRIDLDAQAYQEFSRAGVITEAQNKVRAQNAPHLKTLLQEDHRYVFTTLQKFRSKKGEAYEELTDRTDILVLADEAHRSQYDTYAENMRVGLPGGNFLGFTGTPLIEGEERTKREFGPYVSIYNYTNSNEDGITVPLFYDNRIPELQVVTDEMLERIDDAAEDGDLDEEQERRLEQEFKREYPIITADERLNTIAHDIVSHFMGRGFMGKAMVVSIDKVTAARMFHKVKREWDDYIAQLAAHVSTLEEGSEDRINYEQRLEWMRTTDMALVISQAQNEIEDMREKGIDIRPHRKRMNDDKEDLEGKFKDPKDPLRIVFVCAKWMTGFDVPSCSTIYLDKPLRGHTLMQTITRANRVYPGKTKGEIIDYIGIFKFLKRALSIYATKRGDSEIFPIAPKDKIREKLEGAIEKATAFCAALGIDLDSFTGLSIYARIKQMDTAKETLIAPLDRKREFLSLAFQVETAFKELLPHSSAIDYAETRAVLYVLGEKVTMADQNTDISDVSKAVEVVLNEGLRPGSFVIRQSDGPRTIYDLSRLDIEKLQQHFSDGFKHSSAQRLEGVIRTKLNWMIGQNRTRVRLSERFEELVAKYNAEADKVDAYFQELLALSEVLKEEEARAIRLGLEEEQLTIFDIIVDGLPTELSPEDETIVRKIAQELLADLKNGKLVLAWRRRLTSQAQVKVAIRNAVGKLPDAFAPEMRPGKREELYQHIYETYPSV